jgi:hypothetical protein
MKRLGPTLLLLTATIGCTGTVGEDGTGGSGGGLSMPPSSSPDGSTGPGAAGGLPCDVQNLLKTRCQSCHSSPPVGGAPFSLVSYADAKAHAQVSLAAMMRGSMPVGAARATAAEIQIMQDWISGAFPMAATVCGSTPGAGTPGPTTGTGGTAGVAPPPGGTGAGGSPGTGSGTGGSPGSTGGGTGVPCNVATILQNQCTRCHSSPPTGGAPFSLVSYADASAHATAAVAAMTRGSMPPSGARSSTSDIQALQDWINASFPMGPTCTPPGGGTGGASGGGTGGQTGTGSGSGGVTGTGTGSGGSTGSTGTGGRAGGTGGATGGQPNGLPCDVAAVFQSKCTRCHSSPPTGGAPFSLVSYADAKSHATVSVAAMSRGSMPPSGTLATSAEIQTVQSWINANYPNGTCGSTTGGGAGGSTGGGSGGSTGGGSGGSTGGGAAGSGDGDD